MVKRLVGFMEYGNALGNLDALIKMSSPEELKMLDDLVKQRDEFTVYTNLSRRVQRGPSTLTEPDLDGDKFDRRGLAWITALARVELGSMLAAFTPARSPFESIAATPYDLPQYRELLLDGTRSHYGALLSDPQLIRISRASPATSGTAMLSYSRRLVLARSMLRATGKSIGTALSPAQRQELLSWKQSLDSMQAGFVSKIQQYLETMQSVTSRSSSSGMVNACGALLRAEKREVAAGTARVTPIGR